MWAFIGILGALYGMYDLKKDIENEKTHWKTKKVLEDERYNQKKIANNFENICKTVNIKLDKQNRPVKKEQCTKGIEYLQYQGHSDDTIDVFYNMFMERYDNALQELNCQYNRQKRIINNTDFNNEEEYKIQVFRQDYYGQSNPNNRMEKINNIPSWNKMVQQYRYIHGMYGNAKYTEVWVLKVPKSISKKELKEVYKNTCHEAQVETGMFM